MKEVICSSQNRLIKHVKSLSIKKYRDENNEFIVEGITLVYEALEYGASIRHILVSDEKAQDKEVDKLTDIASSEALNISFVCGKLFKEISETETPQGILAVVGKRQYELKDIYQKPILKVLLLDEVRDPGNMGTIIRTADACGMDAVLLTKGCSDVYGSKVIRSTMGSIFHLPVITSLEAAEVLEEMNKLNILTIGADPYASMLCTEAPENERLAIIIGNEARGLSDSVKAGVRHRVKIPMPGKAESLNAGIAAALIMYEMVVRKGL